MLISFVLFIYSGYQSKKWYRYIFWFLFIVLELECIGSKRKTLDFKLDLAHQRSMVYCNESESIDGTRFQTEPCCAPKSICFSSYGGQKKEMCTVHNRGKNAQGLQSGNKIRI